MATIFNLADPYGSANNLGISEAARPLLSRVVTFLTEVIKPMSDGYDELGKGHQDRWTFAPGQLELLDAAKAEARSRGLWNFFLPKSESGAGLSNLDYAYIAFELGKYPWAPESLNCSAPDSGNMEVLARVGTDAQKKQWLEPLLNGEIRSAFAMTEPDNASSDARNLRMSAVRDGDTWVLNGDKYYTSGAGDPRCKVMLVVVRTDPNGPPSGRHSQFLVPMDATGVDVLGPMHVFGRDDAPRGHMHVRFNDVRVPESSVLLGIGRGAEVNQLRLGPGRIHHCMRSIGAAEKALSLMVHSESPCCPWARTWNSCPARVSRSRRCG